MTIIAWDGKSLAADRQGNSSGTRMVSPKIKKLPNGHVVANTGKAIVGEMLFDWYENGAKPEEWPSVQDGDDYSTLVVAITGRCFFYEKWPRPFEVRDKFQAFGSGCDIALGALAMGASAAQAVEVTNALSTSCGLGVDVFTPGEEDAE